MYFDENILYSTSQAVFLIYVSLEDYDFKINEIHDSMEKIEGEKACALQEFE